MIDFTKPVQTRDGNPVRVLCTDKVGDPFPVVALVRYGKEECVRTYTREGYAFHTRRSDNYLVNVPVTKTVWLNIYEDVGPFAYPTKEKADRAQIPGKRLTCVEVTYEL